MAEVVVATQVLEQLVIVQVALVTELAERVPTVRRVVRVPLHAVPSQVLARVPLALICEDLQGMGGWEWGGGSQASRPFPRPDNAGDPVASVLPQSPRHQQPGRLCEAGELGMLGNPGDLACPGPEAATSRSQLSG